MVNWRRQIGFSVITITLLASSTGLLAQKAEKKEERKLNDAQKREVQTAMKLADDALAGQTVPNDVSLAWVREDFLKAQNNLQFVPFMVTVDPAKVSGGQLALYWRVMPKGAAAAAAEAKPAANADEKKPAPAYAYEDVSFVKTSGNGPMRISRSFTVGAGSYDVVVVAKEMASNKRGAPAPKVSVLRQTVDVPDFWNGEFTTSSVILASKIDPLSAPLKPQDAVDRPYALGVMEITPVASSTLDKKSELLTFMLIYNAKPDQANKPDVVVEYSFYAKTGGAEKFFNRTSPQNLNGQTLPDFDLAAGHQLQTGQGVALTSFPEGDYRLEIKVTDKAANKSLTRNINFTVSGS